MGWNEWPLILFTVLAQSAIGAFWVHAMVLWGGALNDDRRRVLERGMLLLWMVMGLAFFASSFHLGMPWRAINALNRIGQAPLSNEILCGGLFVGFGGLHWLLAVTGIASRRVQQILLGLTMLASIAFLVAMSSFYLMPTVPTWSTPLTPAAFVLTTVLSGFLLARNHLSAAGLHHLSLTRWLLPLSVLAMLASLGVTLMQLGSLPFIQNSFFTASERVPDYVQLMCFRYVLLAAGLGLWRLFDRRPEHSKALFLAFSLVLVGEMLGRGVFYGLYMTVGL